MQDLDVKVVVPCARPTSTFNTCGIWLLFDHGRGRRMREGDCNR